jgi:hypothetical protein
MKPLRVEKNFLDDPALLIEKVPGRLKGSKGPTTSSKSPQAGRHTMKISQTLILLAWIANRSEFEFSA